MSTSVTITDKDLANELELLVDERIQFITQNLHWNREALGHSLKLLRAFHRELQHMERTKVPEWIEDGGIVNKKDD